MARPTRGKQTPLASSRSAEADTATVRIVGGKFRGRKLKYTGELRTRPMKDRVREAVFDLVGPAVVDKHAIDLFAGTGALGLEALSRGAAKATLVEQHFPTAAIIRENAQMLGVSGVCEVVAANALIWAKKNPLAEGRAWLVFCSPPYALYRERGDDMLALVRGLVERSPPGSLLVVETDEQFDLAQLPDAGNWSVRRYLPAVIAIYAKPSQAATLPADGNT